MTNNQRLLTQSNSKLAKADIITLLSNESAWSSLSPSKQQHLYSLLPAPSSVSQAPTAAPQIFPDHTVHPFNTEYAPYIKHFLHEWQNDLQEGRHTQKWRNEAMRASGERVAGLFDDTLATDRAEKWGVSAGSGKDEVTGNGKTDTTDGEMDVDGKTDINGNDDAVMVDRSEERAVSNSVMDANDEGNVTIT